MSAPTAPSPGAPTEGLSTGEQARRRRSDRLLRLCTLVGAALLVLVVLLSTAVLLGAAPGEEAADDRSLARGLQFDAAADADLLTGFERSEFNEKAGPPQIVPSPNIAGRKAIKFSVAPGAQRSEIVPRIPHQREGDVLYFGYNGYLAPDFPVGGDSYQIFMQWHHEADGYSPPISVNARGNSLTLDGGDNLEHRSYEKPVAPVQGGQPINLIMKIVFSRDPKKASIDMWSQGQQLVTNYHPPDGTMFDEGNYLKVGMYRDTRLPGTADIYLNNLAVGTDQGAVERAIDVTPDTYPTGLLIGSSVLLGLAAVALSITAHRRRRRA